MRILNLITLVLCAGCSSNPGSAAVPAARQVFAAQPAIVTPPPITPGLVRMVYRKPMTNCWLEESADLHSWARSDDFEIETNADGSTGWHIQPQADPNEAFRVGGDAL